MNLQTILNGALGGDTISQMSQALGEDENTTSQAVQAALPVLLGALARNSSTPDGASSLAGALDRDHDGSVLDDIAGLVMSSGAGQGEGILGHIFGDNRPQVEQGLSQASGMDAAKIGQLLMMLAPVVMGALGRTQREQGLGAGDLAGVLGGTAQQMGGGSQLLGLLGQMMDANRDGSAVDDVMRLVGGFLGGRR
ncbi:MAG TPA: DUF937 domain-containing protein [Blastocatellia bacterium]|nr:DUF937 domain-containing protein [Blastocatellia bacterium]